MGAVPALVPAALPLLQVVRSEDCVACFGVNVCVTAGNHSGLQTASNNHTAGDKTISMAGGYTICCAKDTADSEIQTQACVAGDADTTGTAAAFKAPRVTV